MIRPIALARLLPPASRKVAKPAMNNTGAPAATLKDRSCTISVVPTLAPSMMASAGTSATVPSAASDAVMIPVAVAALQQSRQPEAGREGAETIAKRFPEDAPQIGTEGPQHASQHHVEAPQQQGHATHQVK